jgi:hypothetical protein
MNGVKSPVFPRPSFYRIFPHISARATANLFPFFPHGNVWATQKKVAFDTLHFTLGRRSGNLFKNRFVAG